MWPRWKKMLPVALLPLMLLAACGDDAEDEPAARGEQCNASLAEPCESGLVCTDDGSGTDRCLAPAGGGCDPTDENPGCAPGTECYENPPPEDGTQQDPSEPPGFCLTTEGGECDPQAPLCATELTCAELQDGTNACHYPVFVEGTVSDSSDESAIEGARIIGLDDQKIAVTDVAVSVADGTYQLALPVVRNADGSPIDTAFTLRADAQDYQPFPSGLRTALPINTSTATQAAEGDWVISGTPTDIVLIPLPADQQGNPSISGSVLADAGSAGVLVVAADEASGYSAVTDAQGNYTIFNVPSGSYEVRGYASGLQLTPEQANVQEDPLQDVNLEVSDQPLVEVNGSVNIVNPEGADATSVVLVVADTFDETFVRGEVPPGLRAPKTGEPDVTGDWSISDVPAGEYVVLAAFENDGLVRDPDQNIGGTDFVTVTIDPAAGDSTVTVGDTFKVTGALEVFGPGVDRPELVDSAPTLQWARDASVEFYTVEVFNAYGDLVWENDNIPPTGGSNVSIQYGGPTESGMYYQFRAKSWRAPGGDASPISTTEDLRGVFFFE